MDYSIFTDNLIQERLENVPGNLREILESGSAVRAVRQIARIHYLDEQRTLILEQLIALTMLGFISLDELSLEISERLRLNYDHSSALAKELKVRIFRPIKDDLETIYSPIEMELQETPSRFATGHARDTGQEEESLGEIKIIEDKDHEPETRDQKPGTRNDAPLILHEEIPLTEEKKLIKPKGFALPFGFFKNKTVAGTGEGVKVKVETSNEIGVKDEELRVKSEETKNAGFVKDGKRVVHYSELRTALTPFDGEDIVNLETLQPGTRDREPGQSTNNESNTNIRILNENVPATPVTPTPTPQTRQVVIPEEPRERTKGFWFFKTNIKPKTGISNQQPVTGNQETVTNASESTKPSESAAVAAGQPKVEGNTIDLR